MILQKICCYERLTLRDSFSLRKCFVVLWCGHVGDVAQLGFIEYVVFPLFETFAKLVQPDCNKLLDILEQNRQHQQEQAKLMQAQRR